MFKQLKTGLLTAALLLAVHVPVFANDSFAVVDETHGVVSIDYDIDRTSEYKVAVVLGDNQEFYPLTSSMQDFALPFGDGDYTVAIYEKVEGKSYALLEKEIFRIDVDEDAQYLASVYDIKWASGDTAVRIAKELVEGAESDQEKVRRIYAYVTGTISYDFNKVASVQSGYVPNLEQTLLTKKGICYDYASLTAAMLRSVGVPTQLCMGYNEDLSAYHAWNNVLVDGQWQIIDTTFDAVSSVVAEENMYKDSGRYSAVKVF